MKELFEFRKLFRFRSIGLWIAVLFILNIANCLIRTGYTDIRTVNEINNVFRTTTEHPDEIYDMYIAPQSGVSQETLSILYGTIESISTYKTDVLSIVKKATANLAESESNGIDHDSYAVRLQEKYIEIYTSIADDVHIGFEYSHGWDIYFSDNVRLICSIAVVFLCSSVIYTHEYVSGFLPIILTTRHGRLRTSISKHLCIIVISILTILVFSASSFIVIGLRIGYSSPYNVIQSVNMFRLCPFRMSIVKYLLCSLIIQILMICVFALFVSTISVITNRYIYIYLSGVGFLGLNVGLYYFNYVSYDNPLKWLNFISSIFVSPLFYQYRACNIFGYPVSCQTVLIVLYTSCLSIGIIVSHIIYCRQKIAGKHTEKWLPTLNKRVIKKQVASHSISISVYESIKLLVMQRQWLLVLCLFLIHIYISVSTSALPITFSEAVYKDYMTHFEGALTPDKATEIQNERSYIDKTISAYEPTMLSYLDGTLSHDEYDQFLEAYRYAIGRDEVFEKIEEHLQYIEQTVADGKNAYFVYDTGWNRIIFSDFQWTLYTAILIIFSSTFTMEFDEKTSEGKFSNILRCSQKGRKETLRAKYILSVSFTVMLSIIWNITSILITSINYALPLPEAPIHSISECNALDFNLTISQTVLSIVLIRILSAALFGIFIVTLSLFFKRTIPVLATAIGTTLLPTLFDSLGISILREVNYIDLFNATPSLINHTAPITFGMFSIITLLLSIYSVRSWMN